MRVLITGISSGIGHALAQYYLANGDSVFGLSRRRPGDIADRIEFSPCDLSDPAQIGPAVERLIPTERHFDLVILNAAILGEFGDLIDADLGDLQRTMQVNVWGVKLVLDELYRRECAMTQAVAISSGAAVNGNRGWSGYAVSKAALNMLVKLYAAERPSTHFCALAPGIVDTAMQETLCGLPEEARYPSLGVLRSARGTEKMPDASTAAPVLATAIARLPQAVESGAFADVRSLA